MNGPKTAVVVSLLATLCAAAPGCRHPLDTYNQGRSRLIAGREQLVGGDRALVAQDFDRAAEAYASARGKLTDAVGDLSAAETSIETEIRRQDRQGNQLSPRPIPADDRSVLIGARTVQVDRYYVDSLYAYRQSLALAVALRALALTREGESAYRAAAYQLRLADELYRSRQFNAAQQSYGYCGKTFRLASERFAEAERFGAGWIADGERLRQAAAPGVWDTTDAVHAVAERRLKQADAYLAATTARASMAGRVVAAYQGRPPGDLPEVRVEPLPDLPDIVRCTVEPPPIPSAETR
ncbi:MAG: hypothetical protein GXY74_02575 [Phycisphaerae bacterium]|nr:hypothetical protein [Phycisphaerae bacterium]